MAIHRTVPLTLMLIYPLLLSVPFLQESVGVSLNIYYFTIPFFLLFVITLATKQEIKILRENLIDCIIVFLLLLLTVTRFVGSLTFPVVFFATLLMCTLLFNNLKGKVSHGTVGALTLLYVVASGVALLSPSNFENLGRFSGFAISASVYSTFLTTVYIVYVYAGNGSRKKKVLLYIIFLLLIFATETRLNLVFFLMLPFLFWVWGRPPLRFISLAGFILALNMIYPLYAVFSEESNVITTYRYEDGRDASFELRYSLFKTVYSHFKSLSLPEKIFGAGPEKARHLIIQTYDYDHMPHQDFVRLLYDFGIAGVSLFVILLVRNALRNEVSFCLTFLYFISFFHNMVYNLLIVLLILFFSSYIARLIREREEFRADPDAIDVNSQLL
ncbi:MAG TPA: O-antigen ligase family protein [Chryseosolibacter sp.]